jgi:hypothetical protein
MRILTQALGLFLGLNLVLIGCGKDSPLTGTDSTSIEVTGYLTESLIHTTSTEPLNTTTPVEIRIVGMPGAATNIEEVKATNIRSGESQTATVQAGGSFELKLMALKADALSLTPVGVDSQESITVATEDIQEFPSTEDDGVQLVYAMDYFDACGPFAEENEPGEWDDEHDEQGDWPDNTFDEEFDPADEEDCEFVLIQVSLDEPLGNGRLIILNLALDLIEPLESEDELVWYGSIRAYPEETLWLVHERDDGSWSTSYLVEVP